jgi:hypothetical protein
VVCAVVVVGHVWEETERGSPHRYHPSYRHNKSLFRSRLGSLSRSPSTYHYTFHAFLYPAYYVVGEAMVSGLGNLAYFSFTSTW